MTRNRQARRLAQVLLLVPSLLLAACGQSSSNGAVAVDKVGAARAYSQCIRDNGVPDFPDPDADGQLRGPAHEKQNDPKFQAAQEKCRNLAPGSEHEKSDPATVEQLRKFSQCMRDNGLPDFPDPDPNGQLRGAGHEQQGNPTYQAAMEACRGKLPGGGDHR
jgi:hypothetical protein